MKRRVKYLFCVPTLFMNRGVLEKCLKSINANAGNSYKIVVSLNYDENNQNIVDNLNGTLYHDLYISNKNFNIGYAVNRAFELYDADYYVFVDEGCEFKNNSWIKESDSIFNDYNNCGIIVNRPHSTFQYYHNDLGKGRFDVLWGDGVMIIKKYTYTKLISKDGYFFNEEYYADCETQELCYRAYDTGIKIIYSGNLDIGHNTYTFNGIGEAKKLAEKSRRKFMKKWGKWREEHYNK